MCLFTISLLTTVFSFKNIKMPKNIKVHENVCLKKARKVKSEPTMLEKLLTANPKPVDLTLEDDNTLLLSTDFTDLLTKFDIHTAASSSSCVPSAAAASAFSGVPSAGGASACSGVPSAAAASSATPSVKFNDFNDVIMDQFSEIIRVKYQNLYDDMQKWSMRWIS
uniref:Uncharacterized protein LOC114337643 n=1 Tax=Diabrotica virgifera virgifera TaxID=50390 RepID=A0A6P7G4S8_DIAVI